MKAKLLKLNSGHIEFVMDCMWENTTKIRIIKKYHRHGMEYGSARWYFAAEIWKQFRK